MSADELVRVTVRCKSLRELDAVRPLVRAFLDVAPRKERLIVEGAVEACREALLREEYRRALPVAG